MAAFLDGQSFLVTITNTDTPVNVSSAKLRRDFVVAPVRVLHPQRVYGGGGVLAVMPEDRDLLARVSEKRPRRPDEFLGLLAAVNRRAARSGRRLKHDERGLRWCVPAAGRRRAASQRVWRRGR